MMRTDELVHFDGDWTPEERRAAEQAIRLSEPSVHVDVPNSCMIAPWICAKRKGARHTVYVARRVNLDHTFEGRSVDELCALVRRPLMA